LTALVREGIKVPEQAADDPERKPPHSHRSTPALPGADKTRGETAEPRPSVSAPRLGPALEETEGWLERSFREALSLQELHADAEPDQFLSRLLDHLFDRLRAFLPYDRIGVALLSEDGRVLRHCWGRSTAPGPDPMAGYAAPVKGSSLQRLLATGQPRVIRDMLDYLKSVPGSKSTKRIVEAGIRSNLTCPICALGRPVGVIFFSSWTPNTYASEHVDTFRLVAERIGRLIETGRLYHHVLTLGQASHQAGGEPSPGRTLRTDHVGSTQALDKPSVLCLEPDPTVGRIYEEVLGEAGLEVLLCAELASLNDLLIRNQPTIVILSTVACGGAPSQELLAEIRAASDGAEPGVILTCPEEETKYLDACLTSADTDEFLLLPFRPIELRAKARLVMKRRLMRGLKAPAVPSGGLFAGKYRIDRELCCGGNSSVYLAHDITSRKGAIPVALKAYSPSPKQAKSRKFLSLFLREAHRHFWLDHPNIVRLLDFGQTNGLYFLVTEYVAGKSLAETIVQRGPLEKPALLRLGQDMAEALHYLDQNRIMHRDIKVGNIMIGTDGKTKLIDFGLARAAWDAAPGAEGTIDGTPMYLAPEVIRGEHDIDIRTDVYALGMTLFHAATGSYPFPDGEMHTLCQHHLTTPPVALHDVAGHLPGTLCEVVDRMLAKRRHRRPTPERLKRVFARLIA